MKGKLWKNHLTNQVFLSTSMILIQAVIYSNEELGLLFRTICEYQNDKKARIDVDPRIMQAFQFFKTQFEYDDKKYMKRVIANR